jgi:hypothetical protein
LETEEKIAKHHSELSLSYKKYSNEVSVWLKRNNQKHMIHFNQQKMFLDNNFVNFDCTIQIIFKGISLDCFFFFTKNEFKNT